MESRPFSTEKFDIEMGGGTSSSTAAFAPHASAHPDTSQLNSFIEGCTNSLSACVNTRPHLFFLLSAGLALCLVGGFANLSDSSGTQLFVAGLTTLSSASLLQLHVMCRDRTFY